MQEEKRAEAEADKDARGEIAEHHDQESRDEHQRITARRPHERRESVLLGHVPTDDGEHRAERRERNVACERRRHDHEQEHEGRMQHAGDGAARSGAHIGGRARDRACDADAAEGGGRHVGNALGDELGIGPMPAPRHAVGDDGRKQAFDRAEKREGEGGGQHLGDLGEREGRQMRGRQASRKLPEARAERLHGQGEQKGEERREPRRDQKRGPMRPPPAKRDDDADREKRDRHRGGIDARQRRAERLELRNDGTRLRAFEGEAEKLLDLAREDDDRDAGSEADRHRIRDVFDEDAEAEKTDRDEDPAGKEGCEDQPVDPVLLHRRRDEHDEGAGGAADLKTAAAKRRDDEAADDRGVKPSIGRDAGRDRDCHGERQRDDRDREAGERVGAQIGKRVSFTQNGDELRRVERDEARSPERSAHHVSSCRLIPWRASSGRRARLHGSPCSRR